LARVVCILSGGIDSSSTVAILKQRGYEIYALTYDYGQRAKREIEAAGAVARWAGTKEHRIIDISFMKSLYGGSNVLTDTAEPLPSQFDPSLIVPFRNGVLLSIAAAYASAIGADVVAYGAHKTDQPYPDCTPEFLDLFEKAVNSGLGGYDTLTFWSPAKDGMTKAQLVRRGYELGVPIFATWSCYGSGEKQCGKCESCINRKKALDAAGIRDMTEYEQPQTDAKWNF